MTRQHVVLSTVLAVALTLISCGHSNSGLESEPHISVSAQESKSESPKSAPLPLTCGNILDNFPAEVFERPALISASDEDSNAFRACSVEGTAPADGWRGFVAIAVQRALTPPEEGYDAWGARKVNRQVGNETCGSTISRTPLPGHSHSASCYVTDVDSDGRPTVTYWVTTARHHTWVAVSMTVQPSPGEEDEVRPYISQAVKAIIHVIMTDGK